MACMKSYATKLLCIFLWLLVNRVVFCQPPSYPVQNWVQQLAAKEDPEQKNFSAIQNELVIADHATALGALKKMSQAGPAGNSYFNARLLSLQAGYYLRSRLPLGTVTRQVQDLYPRALNEAYRTADEEAIAAVSWQYGMAMQNLQELELAATYLLNAAELSKTLVSPSRMDSGTAFRLQYLGELLYHARLYGKSIRYVRQYISQFGSRPVRQEPFIINAWNTLGQDYQKLGKLDSALYCYRRSAEKARAANLEVWKGINAGFTGQVYFLKKQYANAAPLLRYSYLSNRATDANIAGYSLHWLGRMDLAEGKKDSALIKLKTAVQLLEQPTNYTIQNREYREPAYYALADAFRQKGLSDSFYHYSQLYQSLHDSLQTVTVRSSVDLAQMRFENGKNYYAVQLLQQQKRAEEINRNFIVTAILALSVIAILVLLKKKQQAEYRQRLALQEKESAKTEAAAARERLRLFTHHLLEKTALIENLQAQLQDRQMTQAQQEALQALSVQTILTEADWLQFKTIFEKVHGGFFARLRERTPDITPSEQRMAALTRLRFTGSQIASVLGISTDSVRKARQRLRNRLQLPVDADLEEVFAAI